MYSTINSLHNELISKIIKDEQLAVLKYYSAKCKVIDSTIIKVNFPQRMVSLSDSAINYYPRGSVERKEIALMLSDLSFFLLSRKLTNLKKRYISSIRKTNDK